MLSKITVPRFIFTAFIAAAFILWSFALSHAENAAFAPKPIFEAAVGEDSPEKLGKAVNEEEIIHYDKFYFPASFNVFEKLGLVLVLDSNRDRICKFSLKGEFLGEVKLPFKRHAIDFAWIPASGAAFFAFQDSQEIGFMRVDFRDSGDPIRSFKSFKYFGALELTGVPGIKDFSVQRIWASRAEDGAENALLLNVNSDSVRDLAISYNDGKIKKLFELPKNFTSAASFTKRGGAVDIEYRDSEAVMISKDFATGDDDWVELLKEFRLRSGDGGVKNVRAVGTDGSDNVYIEALSGPAEDAILEDHIYKFSRNGKFLGRARIPKSPEMLSNRFIFIDAGGAIFYMKKSDDQKKIQFFRFAIEELN